MTINLSDNSPRVSYNVAAGVSQSAFVVSFEFFDNDDLNVYVDGTLKTITTDYTVTGGDGSTGTVTFVSAVVGASGGSTVVITRDIDLDRTTDFPSSGPFNIASLNTELDRFVAIAADLKDQADRALQLTDFDAAASLTLPAVDDRKGTVLAFNSTTGAVEAGPTTSNVNLLADITDDIATLADIEDGTDATDAIQTVSGISSNVTTVAGISSNVTTVAGISANVTTVAGDEADIGTVAGSISNVNTVATNIADVNTAATNITDIQNASTNATTATTKASEAATSATNAATSATNAATSETNAATSATAAAASQTAAAASAASAATAYDSFDDRYLGVKSSDPTVDNDGNALVSGALYFSSTSNTMQVYDGASWIAATSAGNVSYLLYEYTATSGQTTFSGSDDNSATLSYTVNNIQVVMNGVILDPSDYTATSGTSVVLASGAATGDTVNIYAFKSFTTADMVPASTGGTFSGDVEFAGDVGIGTSSPDRPLHVTRGDGTGTVVKVGNTGTSSATIEFSDTGTTDTVSIGSVGNDLTLKSDDGDISLNATGDPATASLYVERGGNIGIGTTAPDEIIHVVASSGNDAKIILENADNPRGNYIGMTGSDNLVIAADEDNVGTDSNIQFRVDASEIMRVTDNGRILINKTSEHQPTNAPPVLVQSHDTTGSAMMVGRNDTTVTVGDNIGAYLIRSTDSSGVKYGGMVSRGRNTTGDAYLGFYAVDSRLQAGSSPDLTILENMNTYLRNASFVLNYDIIGGTYPANEDAVIVYHNGSGTGDTYVEMRVRDGTGGDPVWRHERRGVLKSEIEENGDFLSATNSYGGTSDERLKENIVASGSQWDDIKALQIKKYSMIEDGLDAPNKLGVIAQDLIASGMNGLVNQIFKTRPNAETQEDEPVLDADGNQEEYYTVKYSILYMKAIKALQEAMERIETLETKVAALEANT